MPHDTTKGAADAQLAAWRRLGPARTAEMALDWSDDIRKQTLTRIEREAPGLSADAYRRKLIAELYSICV